MKGKKGTLVKVMAMGTFVVGLDNTIMNVSIASLVADLNTTVSGVQAAISLNALMMAAFVLMGGKLADIIGMKKTFLVGAVIYVIGSLLGSFSNTILVFILGWCLIQGLGAAMMLPNVNTIIRANIKGNDRGKAYGAIAGINALSTAVGPIIGGFLTTYFSWRWAFRLEVAILLVVLFMSQVIPRDKKIKDGPKLDTMGVAWQASAMMLLVVGVLGISNYGLLIAKQPLMIGSYAFAPFGLSIVPIMWALGILCLVMFARHEKFMEKHSRPTLVDLKLFGIKNFVKGLNVRFLHVFLLAGATFAIPLFLQVTYGLTAFQTGFILLGLTAGLITTAIGGTRHGMKFLPKQKVAWGFGVVMLGLFTMFAYMMVGDSPLGLVPGVFIYGMGLGLVASQIVNLVLSAVEPAQTPEASGVTSTLETLGSSVGTAVVGTVLVIALTSGIVKMVDVSTVFPADVKSEISQSMSTSVDVMATNVVVDALPADSQYTDEVARIYTKARINAFMITMLFMAFVAFIGYVLARRLPAKRFLEKTDINV